MGLRSLIGVAFVAWGFSFVGCSSNDAQKVQPETRGQRGERCQARNDCESGLACLNSVCAKNEFDIEVDAKHCDRIQCTEDAECCGGKPTTAPAKCKNRETVCSPQLPGCVPTGGVCTSDDSCTGGGVCPMGTCSIGGLACTENSECADTCDPATLTCTVSEVPCTVATQATACVYFNSALGCSTRTCSCANPDYDPTDPICVDEDCEDICLLRCEDELCVRDSSCETNVDCLGAAAPLCDDGRCVQCVEDEDCDVEGGQTCDDNGRCFKPCEHDEECPLFQGCSEDGDCVDVGCKDDKECILAAARGLDGGETGSSEDPRLFKCLPGERKGEDDVVLNVCKIPCENDGSCGTFEVCDEGFCKFVGCENDAQCRAYLGVASEMTSVEKPYITQAVCRE